MNRKFGFKNISVCIAVTAGSLASNNAFSQTATRCAVDFKVDFGTVQTAGVVRKQPIARVNPPYSVETATEQQRYIGPALATDEGVATYTQAAIDNGADTVSILPGTYQRVTNPAALYFPVLYETYIGHANGYAHTGNKTNYFLMFDTLKMADQTTDPVYRLALPDLKANTVYTLSWWYANVFVDQNARGTTADLRFDVVDANGSVLNSNPVFQTGSLAKLSFFNSDNTAPRPIDWQQHTFTITPNSDVSGAIFQVFSLRTNADGFGQDFVLDDIELKGDCTEVLAATPVPINNSTSLLATAATLATVAAISRRRHKARSEKY